MLCSVDEEKILPQPQRSEEGRANYVACMAARMDRTSLASLWTLTDPRVAAHATEWVPSKVAKEVQLAYLSVSAGRAAEPITKVRVV
jgi:hypothetical protein